ncbi:hypothetical protein FGO68_gene7858 [Halteria grandinella]|uniref:Uncharacterized protein n=1 Tax=Halteria grandinella TaxID=5974 RepID=A0A8J8P0R5_HALGN|nr:hypothetical protein FGO68_gene7858 [Halteria grandinella]
MMYLKLSTKMMQNDHKRIFYQLVQLISLKKLYPRKNLSTICPCPVKCFQLQEKGRDRQALTRKKKIDALDNSRPYLITLFRSRRRPKNRH